MNIKIKLDIHAFAEERLSDEQLKPPYYGVFGLEIMKPYADSKNSIINFEYDENTCIFDVINCVNNKIFGEEHEEIITPVNYCFLNTEKRFYIDNEEANFSNVLKKYLDPEHTGEIIFSILINCNAGTVAEDGNLRFWVNSKERGKHHDAHIHVRDAGYNYEASIRISDGEIIAGKLPKKLANQAKRKILTEQRFFFDCWNTMTDGLSVDIDRYYGLINY